ncbi:hypothetical protein F5B22DRAFT_644694 [Xylaria bambusicola]|uniref:uncharacterized protein n=1 Tax=Xylaria bambusicola TaxID=326684 RepID=UPI0020078F93|nr:uncharacterized protein F5B22DRAFT_644694 [Xylaria bambusicola]KAI0518390.1 hypothetical protein F5B22DRAFT_644694 [Xylaria bambusicola]
MIGDKNVETRDKEAKEVLSESLCRGIDTGMEASARRAKVHTDGKATSTSFPPKCERGAEERLGDYYTISNSSSKGMRSNGWIERRSRRRLLRLALILVPVPVPVPVPGDAAGCRRQDMGDPSNDGIGNGDSESASRKGGGSVAAEAGDG